MEVNEGKCPFCGHKFFFYNKDAYYYGSPIQTCKKCGSKYIDRRYHEIAIEGIRSADSPSVVPFIIAILIGGFFIYRAFCLFGSYHRSGTLPTNDILAVLFVVFGALFIVFSIIEIIRTLTGGKQRKMDKLYRESDERMQNRVYAQTLENAGYNVPEKYLR